MARVLGLLPSALIAAQGNLSANAFYREVKALGIGARRAEVLQLYKQAVGIVATSREEVFRNPTAVPSANEMSAWPTRSATGIRQNVQLLYRDKTTGQILKTFYSYKSETGVTRAEAVRAAIDAYSGHAEEYDQELIGALHVSTFRYVPMQDSGDVEL